MLCALVHPSILYILTYKRGKSTIWMINILFLFIIHFLKIPDGSFQNIFKLNDEEHYILTHILCWVQLRSISYSMDNIKSHLENKCDYILFFVQNLLYKLAYCLYLPTLSLGPLVLYQEFINSVCIIFY